MIMQNCCIKDKDLIWFDNVNAFSSLLFLIPLPPTVKAFSSLLFPHYSPSDKFFSLEYVPTFHLDVIFSLSNLCILLIYVQLGYMIDI